MNPQAFVPVLLGLQFAAFGWRINREIPLSDKGLRTWLPLPDILNVFCMVFTVALCVIWPIHLGEFSEFSRMVLAIAYTLIAFHPITMAGHYRLFSKTGRFVYISQGKDPPYATRQELLFLVLSFLCAAAAAYFVVLSG